MNTFIARKSDGSKVDFAEGRAECKGLNTDYEAKYCTCDANTQNTSEIPDWATADNVANLSELKADFITKMNACDANTKAAFLALSKCLKSILADMRD